MRRLLFFVSIWIHFFINIFLDYNPEIELDAYMQLCLPDATMISIVPTNYKYNNPSRILADVSEESKENTKLMFGHGATVKLQNFETDSIISYKNVSIFFQNALKILAFGWSQTPVAYLEGGIRPCPLANIFFTLEKYWKTWFPPFVWALTLSEKCPHFWNPKYAIAWSSAPDPAGKRIVLPRLCSFYLGIELGREKEMRYCGIGRKGEYCEASPVLMDHFNQCLCARIL